MKTQRWLARLSLILLICGMAWAAETNDAPASRNPLDDPTFSFTIAETLITYTDGFNTYGFHGRLENLLAQDRTLNFTLEPIVSPDINRMYSICTYVGCYPPDSGTVFIPQTYTASQLDTGLIFDIYNLVADPEWGSDTGSIVGNYQLRITIQNPDDPNEVIAYDLYLEQGSSVTPRIVPVPMSQALLRNYPNPFNPETTIEFLVSQPGAVAVNVFNLLGQNVATLVNSPFMSTGTYRANWRAESARGLPLPTGSYLVELNNSGMRAVHKVLLVR